jgi:GT2 family glycosyltransferase
VTVLSVSVIIVSHGRPDALCVALTGVGQLDYSNYEIVVVADAAGVVAVHAHALADQIKIVPFETRNISAARNAGVAVAAGQIIAFIDDDAVPEPNWLTHLVAPFSDPAVSAAGGYVISRNGISFQWKARTVGPDAQTEALHLSGDEPEVFTGTPTCAIKTEGTNMAVRRDVMVALGGFDPAFQFYLDETDLNMRIGQAGHCTAIVPRARVHHGYAASGRRRIDRVPTDISQIGASLAVYLRKHGGSLDVLDAERDVQRNRLLTHMVAGRLLPSDVAPILAGFDRGCAAGMQRDFGEIATDVASAEFRKFNQLAQPLRFVVGRSWQKIKLLAKAAHLARAGERVAVIVLSPTAFFHRVRFVEAGYWLWTGGQFGKADRSEPLVQIWRLRARAEKIVKNFAKGN